MPVDLAIERRPDGVVLLRSNIPLPPHDSNIARVILERADRVGDKPVMAARAADGNWRFLSYAAFARQVRGACQWLIDHVARGRTLLILGENSPAVAAIYVAGLAAGLRVCPIGPAIATSDDDLLRLRHVIRKTAPAAAFAQDDPRLVAALRAAGDAALPLIVPGGGGTHALDDILATAPTPAVAASIAALDVDAPACLMLTSGSSGLPKIVQLSLANLAANTAQGVAALGGMAGWSESSVDWLPWHHAAGSAVLRASMMLGGTIYIDRGKPAPGLFDETIRNLREVPVPYFNSVPLGYAMLADALEEDALLRRTFFSRLRLMIYGGAGLPQTVMDRLSHLARVETGRYIPLTTGYGATETVSGCMTIHFECDRVGIGLPAPGLEVKLVPERDRYALLLRGPNIMSGYLDDPERTAAAFDAEGFYRTGDLARFQDESRPELGLVFAGRQTEEFKLANGTWVYGGQLRALLLDALAPEVRDIVLCDEDRPFLTLLAWPAGEPDRDALDRIAARVRAFNAARTGSAARVRRIAFLDPPPDPARAEMSDKGGLVRRAVLDNRPDLVAALYAEAPPDRVRAIPD
jgi:feruloyl-CoA synthase